MLTNLIVKNYKSLQSVHLRLLPFMVFVGPNGVGKSNILDCFRILSELTRGKEKIEDRRAGFRYMVWAGDADRTIQLSIEGREKEAREPHEYRYVVDISRASSEDLITTVIKGETFTIRSPWQKEVALLERTEEFNYHIKARDGQQRGGGSVSHAGQSALPMAKSSHPELASFVSQAQQWSFYNLNPAVMRESQPVRRELSLEPDGRNLINVLATLLVEYPDQVQELSEQVRLVSPELRRILTPLTEDGKAHLSIQQAHVGTIHAKGVSDGALRLLGILVALYSPGRPNLLSFEEPENCIHPRVLEFVVRQLKKSAAKSQILITTHSPHLVNLVEPKELFIVENKRGKTVVRKAADRKGVKEALHVLGLGDMWYAGDLGGVP